MKALLRDPAAVACTSAQVLSDLEYGWGNAGWSGQPEYLQACARAAMSGDAPILECGSDVSTLVVGSVAQPAGRTLWSLEHLPQWAARVQQCLDAYGITAVRLCVAPLRDYGPFEWYAPPLSELPAQFGVVICDGPPSMTRGGRYGLLPMMRARLQPGSVILLDDAVREDERSIAERWSREFHCAYVRHGKDKPFFQITLPD